MTQNFGRTKVDTVILNICDPVGDCWNLWGHKCNNNCVKGHL